MEGDGNPALAPAKAEDAFDETKDIKESTDDSQKNSGAGDTGPKTPDKPTLAASASAEDTQSERSSARLSWSGGFSRLAAMASEAFGASPSKSAEQASEPADSSNGTAELTGEAQQAAEQELEQGDDQFDMEDDEAYADARAEVEIHGEDKEDGNDNDQDNDNEDEDDDDNLGVGGERPSEEDILKQYRAQQLHSMAPPSLSMDATDPHKRSASSMSYASGYTDASSPRLLQDHARRYSYAGQTEASETVQFDLPGLLSSDASDWTKVAKPLRHRLGPSPDRADASCPSTPPPAENGAEGDPDANGSRLKFAGATPAHNVAAEHEEESTRRRLSHGGENRDLTGKRSPPILRNNSLSKRSQSEQQLIEKTDESKHCRRVSFNTAVDLVPSRSQRAMAGGLDITAEESSPPLLLEESIGSSTARSENSTMGRVRQSHAEIAAAVERMLDPSRGSLKMATEGTLDELLPCLQSEMLDEDFIVKSWIVDKLNDGSIIEECEGDQIGLVASSASIAFLFEAEDRWCCVYEWKGEHSDSAARANLENYSEQLLLRSSAPPEMRFSRKIDDGSEPAFFFQALKRKGLSLRKLQPHLRGRRRTSPLAGGISWSLVRAPQLKDPNAPERGQAEGSEIWNSFWCFEVVARPDWSGQGTSDVVTATEVDIPSALHGCRSPHSCYILVEVLPDLLGVTKGEDGAENGQQSGYRIPLLGSPGYRSSSGSDPDNLLALSATLWIGAKAPECLVRCASKIADDVRLVGLRAHMPAGDRTQRGEGLADSHLDSSMSSCVSYQDSLNFRRSLTGHTSGMLHSSPFISTTIWADGQDPGGVDDFLHRLAWAAGSDKTDIDSIAQAINENFKDVSPRQGSDAAEGETDSASQPAEAAKQGSCLRLWQVSEVLRRQQNDDFVTEVGAGGCFKQSNLSNFLNAACLLQAEDQLWIWLGAYSPQSVCDLANDIAHAYTMAYNEEMATKTAGAAEEAKGELQIAGIVESGDEAIGFTRWFRGWLIDALPSRRKDAGANFPIPRSPAPRSPTSMPSSGAFSSPCDPVWSPGESPAKSVDEPLDEVIQMMDEKVPMEGAGASFTSFFQKGRQDASEGPTPVSPAASAKSAPGSEQGEGSALPSGRRLFADSPSASKADYAAGETSGEDTPTSPQSDLAAASPATDSASAMQQQAIRALAPGTPTSCASGEESVPPSSQVEASPQRPTLGGSRPQHVHRPSDFPEFSEGRLAIEARDAPRKKETHNVVFGSPALLRTSERSSESTVASASPDDGMPVVHVQPIPRPVNTSFVSLAQRNAIADSYWEKHQLRSVAEKLSNLYESLRWAEQERDTLHRRIAFAAAQELNANGRTHQIKVSPFSRLQQTLGVREGQSC